MTPITIELTEEDAEFFKKFRQHQDIFEILVKAGVFDIRGGTAIITFSNDGILQGIRKEVESWRRGKQKIF